MKKIVQILTVTALAALVIVACKDDFNEEDFLKAQSDLGKDSIALSIQVYNGTIANKSAGGRVEGTQGLTGITVSITADGIKKTATTDADGSTSFFVRSGGSLNGSLSGTGFTTVNFTISVNKQQKNSNSNSTETVTNASVSLPVFETTGARVSKVTGTLTAELNLLNTTRENAPNGVTISFTPSFSSTAFLDAASTAADIDKFSIEGTFIATVSNGAYSIDLPTSTEGIDYTFAVSDFTADQQLAISHYENEITGSVRAVATIPTVFTFGSLQGGLTTNTFTAIPTISAVQLDIEAPPAAFTTAATVSSFLLAPQSVTAGNGFTTVAGGSGYPASSNIAVTVTPVGGAPTTNAILYATSSPSGQITGILANGVDPDGAGSLPASDYGAGYRGRATLTIGGTGSGAIVVPNYASTLASITYTGGAGYVLAPSISVRGLDVNGNAVEDTGTTNINGGSVVAFAAPSQAFSSITSISFRAVNRTNATANVTTPVTVNTFGQITAVAGLATNGSGYNPNVAPLVTVRNLRTGGTGAIVIAEMSTTPGTVANLLVNDPGTGYTAGQANFPASVIPFSIVTANGLSSGNAGTPTIINSLRPGLTRTLNLYAGTGTKTRGVQ